MIDVDIVDLIETQATGLGYNFAYGPRPFLNYETTLKDLKNGKVTVLMLPEVERQAYLSERPTPSYSEFSLFLQFARKWESGNATKSKLDETYDQKYERRLKDLKTTAKSFVKQLACENNFKLVSSSMQGEINLYASNVDAINCEFVLKTV